MCLYWVYGQSYANKHFCPGCDDHRCRTTVRMVSLRMLLLLLLRMMMAMMLLCVCVFVFCG